MKTIYLLRHAEPDFPHGERIYLGGKIDLPLSCRGHEQATEIGKAFATIAVEAVFSSPMKRAIQTAAYIAGGMNRIRTVEMLRELDGGVWDGMTGVQVRARYPEYFVPGGQAFPPPGGESDEHGLMRAVNALNWIEGQIETSAVIVAHSGLNRILLCSLMNMPLSQRKMIQQEYGCINRITKDNQEWRVDAVALSCKEL